MENAGLAIPGSAEVALLVVISVLAVTELKADELLPTGRRGRYKTQRHLDTTDCKVQRHYMRIYKVKLTY